MANQPSSGGGGAGENWGQEWRANISRQVNEGAQALQSAAVMLERVSGRLDDHDRRIGLLESRPDKLRADIGTYGGCSSQVFYIGLGAFNSLLAITGTILAIISLVHHP